MMTNAMRTKLIYFAAMIAIVALGAYLGMGPRAFRIIVHAQSPAQTYSVWTHVVTAGDAPGKGKEWDEFHGQRANGDTVETSGSGNRRRIVSSYINSITVEIDDARKITTTSGTGRRQPDQLHFFPTCRTASDPEVTEADQKTVLGFTVYRVVYKNPVLTSQAWMAPDLACQILEKRTDWVKDSMEPNPGAYDGYTTITATKASADAPNDSYFAIPEGAIEMGYSAYRSVLGMPAPTRSIDQDILAGADKTYADQQAQRRAAGVTFDVFKTK